MPRSRPPLIGARDAAEPLVFTRRAAMVRDGRRCRRRPPHAGRAPDAASRTRSPDATTWITVRAAPVTPEWALSAQRSTGAPVPPTWRTLRAGSQGRCRQVCGNFRNPLAAGQRRGTHNGRGESGRRQPLVLVANRRRARRHAAVPQRLHVRFITDVGRDLAHGHRGGSAWTFGGGRLGDEASRLIRQDDWVVVDGVRGSPSSIVVDRSGSTGSVSGNRASARAVVCATAQAIGHAGRDGGRTAGGNIETWMPRPPHVEASAMGVGLFRSEFLFLRLRRGARACGMSNSRLPRRGGWRCGLR